jgi:hypothetical protein
MKQERLKLACSEETHKEGLVAEAAVDGS